MGEEVMGRSGLLVTSDRDLRVRREGRDLRLWVRWGYPGTLASLGIKALRHVPHRRCSVLGGVELRDFKLMAHGLFGNGRR